MLVRSNFGGRVIWYHYYGGCTEYCGWALSVQLILPSSSLKMLESLYFPHSLAGRVSDANYVLSDELMGDVLLTVSTGK